MAGGYDVTPVDPLDVLRDQLVSLKERVAELERPTGTQLYASLRNPVTPSAATGYGSNFIITTTAAAFASASVTVPDGYTRALVYAGGAANGSGDGNGCRLSSFVQINGNNGPSTFNPIPSGVGWGVTAAFFTMSFSGLTAGYSITSNLMLSLDVGSTAGAFAAWNTATISMQVLFLR